MTFKILNVRINIRIVFKWYYNIDIITVHLTVIYTVRLLGHSVELVPLVKLYVGMNTQIDIN